VNVQNPAPGERPCGGPDWTPEAAAVAASRHGILLSAAHWQILGCAREECLRTRHVPDTCALAKRTGINRDEIERLFPGDACAVIAEIAGMALPEGTHGPAT
jgi:sulfur relay (sulfurtransferase) DsrC/TusE family protein